MWIVLPAVYLLIALVFHAIATRVQPSGNRVHQFLAVGGLVGLVLIWHVAANSAIVFPARVAAILLYAFGSELYVFLFTFVTSSVSVALLVSPKTGRPACEPRDMVRQRLETMHAAGLLQKEGERYDLTAQARRLVRLHRRLQKIFRHRALP